MLGCKRTTLESHDFNVITSKCFITHLLYTISVELFVTKVGL